MPRTVYYPIPEGIAACTPEKSVYVTRKPNGRLSLETGKGASQTVLPVLRGMARFWRSLARVFVRAGGEVQRAVNPTRFEREIARSLSVPDYGAAAALICLRVILTAGVYLYALPCLCDMYLPRALAVVLRTFFAGFMLYRLKSVRVVRRYAMYRGAANKVVNARRGGAEPDLEAVMAASRLRANEDAAFDALVFLAAVFFSALGGDWFATALEAALFRLALITMIAGLAEEARRLPLFGELMKLTSRLVTTEPHIQMAEIAMIAAREVNRADEAGGMDREGREEA